MQNDTKTKPKWESKLMQGWEKAGQKNMLKNQARRQAAGQKTVGPGPTEEIFRGPFYYVLPHR